jgi:cytochrome b subunit of formate dehydrogenase
MRYPSAMLRGLMAAAVLLFLAALLHGFSAPLQEEEDPDQACLDCHGEVSLFEDMTEPQRYVVDRQIFRNSVHGSFNCSDCHQDLAGVDDFPHEPELAPVDCGTCHGDVQDIYVESLHGLALDRGNARAPTCWSCHGAHDILPSDDARSRAYRPNIPNMCASCHGTAGLLTETLVRLPEVASFYAQSVHGQAAQRGIADAAVCTDCHGVHELKGPADPSSPINVQNVSQTCGQCHQTAQSQYDRSIHGRALKAGIRDSPTCTDCHGEHFILGMRDRSARTYSSRLAHETCGRCHEDPVIIQKYGMADYVVETYIDSYHGWATRWDSDAAATCVSCHTAHLVLPERDPASTISPQNVTATCRQCHPGADDRFAASYTHRTASIAANPITRWIRNAYIVLILLVVGGMLLHNLVIFVYYLVEKRRMEESTPSILRLDRIQVYQHLLLAITFTVLVITGFALRFPDAWWVRQLAAMGMTEPMRSWIHRVFAVGLIIVAISHVLYITVTKRGREELQSMVPMRKDAYDFVEQMRFHTWLRKEELKFGRYDYTQKVEYWALVWGTILMAVTGFVLWFPATAVRYFPTWIVQASETIHYYEAWLATLAIIVWHFFFTIVHPREFPMSWTWITGRMPVDHVRGHHAGWYEEELQPSADRREEEPGEAGAP